jgi:hypothetical protein
VDFVSGWWYRIDVGYIADVSVILVIAILKAYNSMGITDTYSSRPWVGGTNQTE